MGRKTVEQLTAEKVELLREKERQQLEREIVALRESLGLLSLRTKILIALGLKGVGSAQRLLGEYASVFTNIVLGALVFSLGYTIHNAYVDAFGGIILALGFVQVIEKAEKK
jgi:hypothetical protein